MNQVEFQNELTRLGGLNVLNQPNLRVVTEQELTFACGRMIPKYRTGRVFETVTMQFRLRNMDTGKVKDCSADEAKAAWLAAERLDRDNKFIPETWRSKRLTLEPKRGFYVEQFFPPEKIKDTPANWEANRFRVWLDPEKEAEVLTDIIGPFPVNGRYEGFYSTSQLSQKALDEVTRAWARRHHWHQDKSDELMVVDIFAANKERVARDEIETAYLINSELSAHFSKSGDAHIYQSGFKKQRRQVK